jgi:hypothetical protein
VVRNRLKDAGRAVGLTWSHESDMGIQFQVYTVGYKCRSRGGRSKKGQKSEQVEEER